MVSPVYFCTQGTFIKSENPDEMPHDAAFHHSLHVLSGKTNLQTIFFFFKL